MMRSLIASPRRRFITRIAGAIGLAPLVALNSAQVPSVGGKFVHMVYFWLKEPEDATTREKFLRNLIAFLNRVEVINSYHVGQPANTPRDLVDNSYTFALAVTFDGRREQDIYQDHPAHKKFIEQSSDLWNKVLIYDSISVA